MSTSTYFYSPLPNRNSIRILRLLPGKPADPIHCTLDAVALGDVRRRFEALSYVWGDATNRRTIHVDGAPLLVTVSLYDALANLRRADTPRTLWTDAVCINQHDKKEQSHQVQMMGDVYGHARSVPVWLGHDDKGLAKETFDFLRSAMGRIRVLLQRHGSIHKIPVLDNADEILCLDKRGWDLLSHLANRPWFSRVWVLQEVGVAVDAILHWGTESLPLSELINIIRASMGYFIPFLFPFAMISNALDTVWMTYNNSESWRRNVIPELLAQPLRSSWTFIDVLLSGSRRKATDGRDYVYAFLGHPLAVTQDGRGRSTTLVRADYNRTVEEVYCEVAAALVEHSDPCYMLTCTSSMGQSQDRDLDSKFPSWVPQWNLGRRATALGQPHQWYSAGGKTREFRPVVDRKTSSLTARGLIFDCIDWTSSTIDKQHIEISTLGSKAGNAAAIGWLWKAVKDR